MVISAFVVHVFLWYKEGAELYFLPERCQVALAPFINPSSSQESKMFPALRSASGFSMQSLHQPSPAFPVQSLVDFDPK